MVRATCYDSQGTLLERLYQWDLNRSIKVEGLTVTEGATVFFHFCNEKSSSALVIEADVEENSYTGAIPNVLLSKPDTIYLYVFERFGTASESRTIETIRIPLVPRRRPDDYIYEETPTIRVANGLVIEDGKIFLADGGKRFGTGVPIEGTNVAGATIPYMFGTIVSISGETEVEDDT